MTRSTAEVEFHKAVMQGSASLKADGYNPSRFLEMVADLGAPQAARQLLQTSNPSDGFTTLWEMHRLDMSVEAMALLPWYEALFTVAERENARRRLEGHGFDVDAFLRSAAASPPPWA